MHLSRVSITDYRGNVILDSFVRPTFVPFAWVERWFINIYSSSSGTASRITGPRKLVYNIHTLLMVCICVEKGSRRVA